MPNPYRILAVLLIAALSVGGMAVMRPPPPVAPEDVPQMGALYAAPVERVETHVLGQGETISEIFTRAAIGGQQMTDLLLGLRRHVNPRRLSDGVEITVRRWVRNDAPRAIEVRLNADSTLRLAFDGIGWQGKMLLTPVVVDTVYTAGTVAAGRTVYAALVYDEESTLQPNERIQLVYELAEIYEYKLDFSREIQPGDSYRLVYEREARPDGSARSRTILAAEIVTSNTPYTAIWFEGDENVKGYYDKEGRPLRTGFSRYPVDFARITSNYTTRRFHPVLGIYRSHLGTDFGASTGTPVKATADGTVLFAGVSGGYGNLIRIRHMNGYETRYAHLSRIAAGIRPGARVKQKQVIGRVGATGLVTGPHLHYELRKNGTAVNALRAKLPDAPPLAKKYLETYQLVMERELGLLEDAERRYLALKELGARVTDH